MYMQLCFVLNCNVCSPCENELCSIQRFRQHRRSVSKNVIASYEVRWQIDGARIISKLGQAFAVLGHLYPYAYFFGHDRVSILVLL